MKRFLIVIFLLFPVISYPSLPDGLVSFLTSRIEGGVIGEVERVLDDFLIGRISRDFSGQVLEGDEVVILKREKDLPVEFLGISAIARVDGISGDAIKITPLVTFGEIKEGDIISFPRKLNLIVVPSEGVPRKDVSDIMKDLISLRNTKVKEVYTLSTGDFIKNRSYYMVLKLSPEYGEDGLYISISLESLYTRDIFAIAKIKSSVPISVGKTPEYVETRTPPAKTIFSRKRGRYGFDFTVESILSDDIGGYRCIAAGDLDGDRDDEVALLGKNDVLILDYKNGKYTIFLHQPLPIGEVKPINVDIADINGNGLGELFVTIVDVDWDNDIPKPRVFSYIYELQGKSMNILYGDIPLFLRVVRNVDGRPILLAQEMGKYTFYQGKIYQIVWDGKEYSLSDPPPNMRGIKKLYGFAPIPGTDDRFVYVDDVGRVAIMDGRKWKRVKWYDTTIGLFDEISIPLPLEVPEAHGKDEFVFWEAKSRERRVDLIPEFENQIFTIDKGKLKSKVMKLFASTSGEDSIIGFSPQGSSIEETWRGFGSRRYISDFAFGDPSGLGKMCLFVLELGEDGSSHLEVLM